MEIGVFKHSCCYDYLAISVNVLDNVYMQTKKTTVNVIFLFLLRIMMKHKMLQQDFLLVWKCIHVMVWVSWTSLFPAYLRYVVLVY